MNKIKILNTIGTACIVISMMTLFFRQIDICYPIGIMFIGFGFLFSALHLNNKQRVETEK